MSTGIERMRAFARNLSLFWQGITLAFLLLDTGISFAQTPRLFGEPRGWLIGLLAVAYGGWYIGGMRWMAGDNGDAYWARLGRGELSAFEVRRVTFWAGMLLITTLLSALDPGFRWMFFPVFGMCFALASPPGALVYIVPTALLISAEFGWLPQTLHLADWLQFALELTTMAVYTALAYVPFLLLQGRFEREHVYAELERSHAELADAHRQLAESAARDRELAVFRERERLARDMHDTLGHTLALMAVKLDAAQRLRKLDPTRADHEVAATQEIARGALAELRRAIADLRAPTHQREPLGEALARQARELGLRSRWQVTYDIDPDVGEIADRVYEALLRIGGEALANAERHAAAANVTLALKRDGEALVLRVADDGRGILTTNPPLGRVVPPTAAHASHTSARAEDDLTATGRLLSDAPRDGQIASPPGHYGIRGMRERAIAAGGSLSIGPLEGSRGTLVEARFPAWQCVALAVSESRRVSTVDATVHR